MIRRILVIAVLACVCAGGAFAADFYVAPNASANGSGTLSSPWKLQTALNQPSSVHPGDTIWLRGGTYSGTFTSNLNGSTTNPIVVRGYAGEWAKLDGGSSTDPVVSVKGSNTWFWGFEVMSSDTDRQTNQTGSWPTDITRGDGFQIAQEGGGVTHPGLKFINLVVHDTRQGFSFWEEAVGGEISGCLVYYSGWTAPDRGHGHNIYSQNQGPIFKNISNNVIFSGFALGIQIYGSDIINLDDYTLQGNTIFNSGDLEPTGGSRNLLIGGSPVAKNPEIFDNSFYRLYGGGGVDTDFKLGYSADCSTPTITGNYIATSVEVDCTGMTVTGNDFYGTPISGISQSQFPANVWHGSTRPSGTVIRISPNVYEAGRANITVYNWANQNSVNVDLAGIVPLDSAFEIRNAQNFFAPPVLTGTYAGGMVALPMNGLTPAAPVGLSAPDPTGPEFNVFVVTSSPGPWEFLDVPLSDPFHDAISLLAKNGVTAGCSPGYFCPLAPVARDQMAVFLLKSEHGGAYSPPPASGQVFGDVPANAFAAAWIEQLAAEGITSGCGDGDYCPGSPVSRAQMAVFLLKAEHGSAYNPPAATGTVFDDVPANAFAAAWIEQLFNEGISAGCDASRYCPDLTVSREQMAALLVNTFNLQ